MGSFPFSNLQWQGRVDYSFTNYTGYSKVTATFYDKFYKSAQLSGGFYGWLSVGDGEPTVISYSRYSSEWTQRATMTVDIPVGQDGYADVRIAVTVTGEVTLSGEKTIRVGNGTAYGKKSNVALSPASVKMGEDIIITTNGGQGTIKHTFRYTYGTLTTKQLIKEDVVSSMTWTVPDLCAYTEDGDDLVVYCETFTSDRSLGETNAKITVYPPDATKPSMGTSEMGREATIETPRGSGNYSISLSWKMAGQTGVMPALRRLSNEPYRSAQFLVPIEQVMLTERVLPQEYITPEGNGVTQAYVDWLTPLMGQSLPRFVDFNR